MICLVKRCLLILWLFSVASIGVAQAAPQEKTSEGQSKETQAAPKGDFLRQMQLKAIETQSADWIHWGDRSDKFSTWTNHSNRLIPVYAFGMGLDDFADGNSLFRDKEKLREVYGYDPENTLSTSAKYFDQTDIQRLQLAAVAAGKKNVILFVCDGMDWQTTQAAAIYKNGKVPYTEGRGSGLSFLDFKAPQQGFGYMVTSPYTRDAKPDVNSQTLINEGEPAGGYIPELGGKYPWSKPSDPSYLLGKSSSRGHAFTDSAASATSMTTGKKTYNGSINIGPEGEQLRPIAHELQEKGFAVGVVSSVPFCHATPAACYAHNVTRNDYQDIARDMLGLRSVSHKREALSGLDVVIGCGWGETTDEGKKQGNNFLAGNKFLAETDLEEIDRRNGGDYRVVQRQAGKEGAQLLKFEASKSNADGNRLFGFFGGPGGHLPYRTADGKYDPTRGIKSADVYKPEDISENPTLAQMATAALNVLQSRSQKNGNGKIWLMVESGDIDWANHNNNIDDSIGAVLDAAAAFTAITHWVEAKSNWDETVVILTADHGHMMVLDKPESLLGAAADGSTK